MLIIHVGVGKEEGIASTQTIHPTNYHYEKNDQMTAG